MKISREVDVEVDPTPAEMAGVFVDWDGEEQALFFEEIANYVKSWNHSFCFQAQNITDSTVLTNAGRNIMRTLGEYSEKS